MNNNAVQLSEIGHRYGKVWGLSKTSLTIRQGECIALLGPNGCGKTTLLKILATRLEPTRGEGKILGFDLRCNKDPIRLQVEWLGHELGLYKTLTASENLIFSLHLRGQKNAKQKIGESLEKVGLFKEAGKQVHTFSTGMCKRLSLARMLLQNPSLVLLDEPHANLDKEGKALMNTCIQEWKKKGATIVFSSHDHPELYPYCDRTITLWGSSL